MQSISAGVNPLDFRNIDKKIVICSNADAWSIPVAEHAMALILASPDSTHFLATMDATLGNRSKSSIDGTIWSSVGFSMKSAIAVI